MSFIFAAVQLLLSVAISYRMFCVISDADEQTPWAYAGACIFCAAVAAFGLWESAGVFLGRLPRVSTVVFVGICAIGACIYWPTSRGISPNKEAQHGHN